MRIDVRIIGVLVADKIGRFVHGKSLKPALEMIVNENRAAYDRKRRVATDKILRRIIYEIEKFDDSRGVDFHGSVLAVDRYTVLSKVRVRRELPKPLFAAQSKRHVSQILS